MAKYTITIDANKQACELGACNIAFANGKAETDDSRAAAWYKEHAGYTVTESKSKAAADK